MIIYLWWFVNLWVRIQVVVEFFRWSIRGGLAQKARWSDMFQSCFIQMTPQEMSQRNSTNICCIISLLLDYYPNCQIKSTLYTFCLLQTQPALSSCETKLWMSSSEFIFNVFEIENIADYSLWLENKVTSAQQALQHTTCNCRRMYLSCLLSLPIWETRQCMLRSQTQWTQHKLWHLAACVYSKLRIKIQNVR